jgi:hypothetical protein
MTGLGFVRPTALSLILLAAAASSASGSTDAHTTLISGAGDAYMKVIISSDGNVWYFEAPSGKSHISTAKWFVAFEGYVLCSSAGTSWDAGSTESGWGQSTISQLNGPNTVPLTITRTTSNRKLQLKQLFTRDAAEQELKIEQNGSSCWQ